MKILIMSDSHGKIDFIKEEIKSISNLDLIIHLGDYTKDAEKLKKYIDLPFKIIKGNNDFGEDRYLEEEMLKISGYNILLTHGHKYKVYFTRQNLYYRAKELGADIVLYGHTHVYKDEFIDEIRLINPGSISYPRGGDYKRSYIILDFNKDLSVNRITIG